MTSRLCPTCIKITSSSGNANFCAWCGEDLRNEPILPPYEQWSGDANEMAKIAYKAWQERQELITPEPEPIQEPTPEPILEDIGNGRFQIKLF